MKCLALLIVIVGYATLTLLSLWGLYEKFLKRRNERQPEKDHPTSNSETNDPVSAYNDIVPLLNFDWETTEPLKYRSFKKKFHLTMGLTNSTFSSLIEMDKNYLTRIELRKQIIADHRDIVLQASSEVKPAVDELFTYLISFHLPTRFPTLFSRDEKMLMNLVTGESFSLIPNKDPVKSLEILGGNLDEEFAILLPSDDGDGYSLKGYVLCFPSGFNTKEKFSLKLRDIHKPVPGYKEKLELSMDRYFDRLEVGKIVMRSNWAITTHSRLFVPSGNHLYVGQEVEDEDIDIGNTHYRSERQMLWRLPQTQAIIFSFKTYLSPLQEIKNEGLGIELAQAIEGLKEGSVPAMNFYKKGVVWGDAVKKFLRS